MMQTPRIAILDDTQSVALRAADWTSLAARAEIVLFDMPFADEDEVVARLADFDIIVPMRERTPLPASVIDRLPRLKMIALTGLRSPSLDLEACARRGIVVSNTGVDDIPAATSEMAWALLMACARAIPQAAAVMARGGWHAGVPMGLSLAGKRLGIAGLGRLGSRVARYAKAFDMEVVAWSENLTAAAAAAQGATLVPKAELFATSDIISLHLVLSQRTRHIVGAAEIAAIKPGGILINTARGPLVDTAALLDRLRRGDIMAGLDVYDEEPLAADSELRRLPNVVLAPHLGYATWPVFGQFYGQSVENIRAYLDGTPIRLIRPG